MMIIVLIASILNPLFSKGANVRAMGNETAEEILSSLSQEQRTALKTLEANHNEGLIGFDQGELTEEKETTVIVEFQTMPEEIALLSSTLKGEKLTKKAAKDKMKKEQETFKEYAKKNGLKVDKTYQTTFNGMAVIIPANEIEGLLNVNGVKAVYKSHTFSIEPDETMSGNEEETPHMADSIPFLGIDKLHEEGITGKGVKVGVIDTGIDYHHPDLKDAFAGGYDVVDDDNDPMETTYDDWKKSGRPLTSNFNFYYTTHGTHVSGTIAAQANNTGGVRVKGVAPDVELYGYRVLGPYGSGQTEDIIAGIDRAVADGMDVINLSLGSNINEPLDPTSIAVNNAVLNGVVAVVSAGNNGSRSYSLGTPGSAALALTVGASSTSLPITSFDATLNNGEPIYIQEYANDFVTDLSRLKDETVEVVDLGDGKESDYEGKDITDKVVFVNHGVIGTQDKIVYAKEHGAKAVIVYYSDPEIEEVSAYAGEDHKFIPSFYMTNQDGNKIKELLASGKVTLTFTGYTVYNTKEDELANFSSRGPSRLNMDIKPEITAPGVSILSTVPAYAVFINSSSDYQYAYDRYSGTSMAAPHVTGIAALMLQQHPDLKPQDIKAVLMNTAVPLNGEYSVFDVGAGRVDPYEAIHSNAELKVKDTTPMIDDGDRIDIEDNSGGIRFGSFFTDEGNVRTQKSISIENKSNKKKHFEVGVEFTPASLDSETNGIQVVVDDKVKVKPNSTIQTNVFLTVPKTAEIGMYEGYITFENKQDPNESYRIPFAFRTMEGGFNLTELSSPAISPKYLHDKWRYYANTSVDLRFNFKSPMEKVDVVLTNGKTGEDLGFLGTLDLTSAYDGVNYILNNVFNGEFYAFTGDESQPIESVKSKAQPGHYKIKIIGTSKRDLTFTQDVDLFIDPHEPTITSELDNRESPVIEYSANQELYTLPANVYDPEVEKMIAVGMDVDQSINTIDYSINGNYNPEIPVDKDGNVDLTVSLDENKPLMKYSIYANDSAGNRSETKSYYFIKENMPYGYISSIGDSYQTGETFLASLVLNHVENMVTGEWTILNFNKYFELVEATPNETITSEADPIVKTELKGNNLIITLDTDKPLTGEVKAVNLNMKVKDTSFQLAGDINPAFHYLDSNNTDTTIPHAGETLKIVPTFSEIYGKLQAGGLGYTGDWTKADATIKLLDQNGNEYHGTESLDRYGFYRVSGLPITDKPFIMEVHLPGHFIIKKPINAGIVTDEYSYGQLLYNGIWYMTPGDINQDDVIDIFDALSIKEHWGSGDRESDINNDGTIDSKDMNFVVKNYLTKNPDVKNTPEPQSESDGKNLQDILAELGMTP